MESNRTTSKPKRRLYVFLSALAWGIVSAVIIAYFFFSAFFPEYAPIVLGAAGIAILVIPAFTGFLMGIMLSDYEEKVVIYGSFFVTLFAIVLIFVVLFLPLITGIAADVSELTSGDERRQAVVLSSIFILPIALVGGIAGKAFGDTYLPSDEERALRRMLAKDTKRWHEMLQAYSREKEKEKEQEETPEEKPPE
jgi:hypothetical protein